MSFKALTLAASIVAAFAVPSFAGSTSALDIDWIAKSAMSMDVAPMAAERTSVSTVRGSKVEQILRDCRFVNTKETTYCDAFKQSNQ